nr:probable pseudouridine-5'-phosphatase [Rhipicephalus microplus]
MAYRRDKRKRCYPLDQGAADEPSKRRLQGVVLYRQAMERLMLMILEMPYIPPYACFVGAERLVRHLDAHVMPMAIAIGSKRRTTSNCCPPFITWSAVRVFEYAVKGVIVALAAGMQVVIVADPRIDEEHRRQTTTYIALLLEFKAELFGLPPIETASLYPKQLQGTFIQPSTAHRSLTDASLRIKV